ncbi:uncharacterized protein LOC119573545 [Penaeus monodon]|uniref:uncharacterized protein LOC119573545 n=1 Tax=Penaeus monodon TaxID=6687 RepID=UPI0018A7312C|nr:uncharacterized protein LOC119573545 [Penaeus monodon]
MLYGNEALPLTKRQEDELKVAEMKMLNFSLGVMRMDKVKNEYDRGTMHVRSFGDKAREAKLRWSGHIKRRDEEFVRNRMLEMELPGKRRTGRPKRRFLNAIKMKI